MKNTKWIMFSILSVVGFFLPMFLEACPLCVDATPYKNGLLIAVLVLLPVPFILAGGLFLWIRRMSRDETQPS
jgi:hypothetical protein